MDLERVGPALPAGVRRMPVRAGALIAESAFRESTSRFVINAEYRRKGLNDARNAQQTRPRIE